MRLIKKDKEPEKIIPWHGMGDTREDVDELPRVREESPEPYSPIDIGVRVQTPLNAAILAYRESKVATFDKLSRQIRL